MSIVDKKDNIRLKVEEIVKAYDAEIFEFKIFSSRANTIIRCVVDYAFGGITLKVCAAINKAITLYLDENDILGQNFTVEINSPGLDKPLRVGKDFLRVKGRDISLWLNEPVEGKEYLEGQVAELDEYSLFLKSKDKVLSIKFEKIKLGKEQIKL